MKQLSLSSVEVENIVIVNVAAVSRALIVRDDTGELDQICWSSDTQRPDSDVIDRQAPRCIDCKHNIRGSQVRRCAYQQILAVVKEDNLEEVYRLKLPATSIFGKTTSGMPLQQYAKYIAKNNTNVSHVVTCMYRDTKSSWPKVFFKPVRSLEVEERHKVNEVYAQPHIKKVLTLSAFGSSTTPSPFSKVEGYIHNNHSEE